MKSVTKLIFAIIVEYIKKGYTYLAKSKFKNLFRFILQLKKEFINKYLSIY